MLGVRQWRHGAFCVSRQHRLCRLWPRRIFMYYSWKAVVFIHRLWNYVYHRRITNNFPCKWHRTASTAVAAILAEEDSPLKLLWRTPIKIHRRAHRRRQPRSRENAKATSSKQRPQTCTEAATKYYNYTLNETNEERQHRLPTLPKAARLDQATLKDYSQNYFL